MPNTKDDLDAAHSKGQSDGARNDYAPPNRLGVLDILTTPSTILDDQIEENEVYRKGWDNGYKQRS